MARQQNTFEKLRREMEKKRKAKEKMERKRAKKEGDTDPSEDVSSESYATRKVATKKMTDAEILRAARNM